MDVLTTINDCITFYGIFPFVIVLGAYLTWRLRGIQVTSIAEGFRALLQHRQNSPGTISPYGAVSAVLAGNLGTGNISGIAVALATGGPGALVWMWVMAFFGAVIQYASCVLGIHYRQRTPDGGTVGGPLYYLSVGLRSKTLAIVFAVTVVIAALTVGNFVQVNSVTQPLEMMSIDPLIGGLILTLFVAIVMLGGVERFAKVASSVVPLMALLYLGAAIWILIAQWEQVGPAFFLMLESAWRPDALLGGTLGFTVVKTIVTGFGRGIFATDAGTGMAPMLQSRAQVSNPKEAGLIALVPPFLVMVVCTITGLVLIVTDAWTTPGLSSTNMCLYAFDKGLQSSFGSYIVMIALLLFAYTTILAWACCGEQAIHYLCGSRAVSIFRYVYIVLVPVGTLFHVSSVWLVADIAISLMMLTNLLGIAALSETAIALSSSPDDIAEAVSSPSMT